MELTWKLNRGFAPYPRFEVRNYRAWADQVGGDDIQVAPDPVATGLQFPSRPHQLTGCSLDIGIEPAPAFSMCPVEGMDALIAGGRHNAMSRQVHGSASGRYRPAVGWARVEFSRFD